MRKFLLGLACVALVGACGRTDTEATEECEECTCDGCCEDMIPAVHSHPDAQPVGTLEATGRYELIGFLTVDTCADPSLADPEEEIVMNEWMLTAMQDEYLFMQGEFVMVSHDGETFVLTDEGIDFWTGCEYSSVFTAVLSFTNLDMSGTIDLHHEFPECDYDLDGTPDIEELICDRTWEILGTKQTE